MKYPRPDTSEVWQATTTGQYPPAPPRWNPAKKARKAFDEVAFVAWLARIEDKAGTTAYQGESRHVLRARCGRAECVCPHLFPCEAGWTEVDDGGPNHGMLFACNVCRPTVCAVQREAGDRETLQAKIRNSEFREQATNTHAWS